MTEFDEFKRIAEDLNDFPCEFSALFRQAEVQLAKDKPGGYDVTEIGKRAWSRLAFEHWPEAFRTLFYCFWLVYREERNAERMHEAAMDAGTAWMDETSYQRIQSAIQSGPDEDGHATEVDYGALSDLAHEVSLLRERLALLRKALDPNPF